MDVNADGTGDYCLRTCSSDNDCYGDTNGDGIADDVCYDGFNGGAAGHCIELLSLPICYGECGYLLENGYL